MAEVESATAGPGEKRSAGRPRKAEPAAPAARPRASESGDPAVHQLLADAYIARQNGDDDKAEAAEAALRELGYA
jgi:hypothetical protein